MDPRERYYDPEETLRMLLESGLARVWTALPGIVQSFDRNKLTVEVQPAINGLHRNTDNTWSSLQMPKLVDVPVYFPGGGGVTLTFDVKAGDECLVVFAARCIDSWWALGGVADPTENRMHNLSDGFALVGVRSQPRKFSVDAGVCRLRTDDDGAYFEVNPTTKAMKAVFPGGITLNGVTIDTNGNVESPASITADTTLTGKSEVVAKTGGSAVHLSSHVHPSNGQPPTPGS